MEFFKQRTNFRFMPVRGFAVTLCLGILTSLFSAILGSRALIHVFWGRQRKLEALPI